jgi:hypothetical protein
LKYDDHFKKHARLTMMKESWNWTAADPADHLKFEPIEFRECLELDFNISDKYREIWEE